METTFTIGNKSFVLDEEKAEEAFAAKRVINGRQTMAPGRRRNDPVIRPVYELDDTQDQQAGKNLRQPHVHSGCFQKRLNLDRE